jgi:RimJ/RimL family protein N-acetyltransferase
VPQAFKLQTKRLYLRELTPDDAEAMYLLNLDEEVIRYTGDPPFMSIEAAKQFLEGYDQYERYGVGRWAVIRTSDAHVLGWCGLKYHPQENMYDIGYRFFKKYWNRGYATEAASCCLTFGHQTLGIQTIIGHALKTNIASIRVFEKLGMTLWKEGEMVGESAVFYRSQKAI